RNFFMNHTKRDIPEPKITQEEARSKVNPGVDIKEDFLAVIDNELGDEVLTYEFIGTLGDDTYRVFINAMNGTEERVEKLNRTGNISRGDERSLLLLYISVIIDIIGLF